MNFLLQMEHLIAFELLFVTAQKCGIRKTKLRITHMNKELRIPNMNDEIPHMNSELRI